MEYKEQLEMYVKSNERLLDFSQKSVKHYEAEISFKEVELSHLKSCFLNAKETLDAFEEVITETKKEINLL